jgi:hypothetical protein
VLSGKRDSPQKKSPRDADEEKHSNQNNPSLDYAYVVGDTAKIFVLLRHGSPSRY